MALTDGLIEFWKLSETSGTRNGSLGNFNLADTGSTGVSSFQPEFNETVQGTAAATFTGSTALSVASAANLQIDATRGFTISAWVKLNALTLTDQMSIVGKGTAGAEGVDYSLDYLGLNSLGGFSFRMGSNFGIAAGDAFSGQFGLGGVTPITGVWYHLVGIYTPATATTVNPTISIYVNNERYRPMNWANIYTGGNPIFTTSQVVASTSKFAVGAHVTSADAQSKNLTGAVCNVGIWRRTLRENEIGDLYFGGYTRTYPFTGA